jgi:hypothetical protein
MTDIYFHFHVHCSDIHTSQSMETTEMHCDNLIDKENVKHTFNVILVSLKKKKILPFETI